MRAPAMLSPSVCLCPSKFMQREMDMPECTLSDVKAIGNHSNAEPDL